MVNYNFIWSVKSRCFNVFNITSIKEDNVVCTWHMYGEFANDS